MPPDVVARPALLNEQSEIDYYMRTIRLGHDLAVTAAVERHAAYAELEVPKVPYRLSATRPKHVVPPLPCGDFVGDLLQPAAEEDESVPESCDVNVRLSVVRDEDATVAAREKAHNAAVALEVARAAAERVAAAKARAARAKAAAEKAKAAAAGGGGWNERSGRYLEAKAHDLDGDNMLDFDEFCALVREREAGEHTEEELRERFVALDADGSGQVDFNEYAAQAPRSAAAGGPATILDAPAAAAAVADIYRVDAQVRAESPPVIERPRSPKPRLVMTNSEWGVCALARRMHVTFAWECGPVALEAQEMVRTLGLPYYNPYEQLGKDDATIEQQFRHSLHRSYEVKSALHILYTHSTHTLHSSRALLPRAPVHCSMISHPF